jgi:hypothetical protein
MTDLTKIEAALLSSVPMLDVTLLAVHKQEDCAVTKGALCLAKERIAIFSVDKDGEPVYPAFQFDDVGTPLPVIAEILGQVSSAARGWALLSWFNAKNTLLLGYRPREIVASRPDDVCRAACAFYSIYD